MKHPIPTIFLAGDSTVQSYTANKAPQTGWGQTLIHFFCKDQSYKEYHSPFCTFPEATCYEAEHIRIDNRAMAGRSSRTFLEEGRLDDLLLSAKPGDYLFIQFGHNDANQNKPERYVSVSDFPDFLMNFVEDAKSRQVTCVLVTPIVMREYEYNGQLAISFPVYRDAMLQLSVKQHLPLIDLGLLTKTHCENLGSEACKFLFLWVSPGQYPSSTHTNGTQDNAHLQYEGAMEFARLLASGIRDYTTDDQLDDLKLLLSQ